MSTDTESAVKTVELVFPLPAAAAVQALRELPTYTEVVVSFSDFPEAQHFCVRGYDRFTNLGSGTEWFIDPERGFPNLGEITRIEVVKVYDSEVSTLASFVAAIELVEE